MQKKIRNYNVVCTYGAVFGGIVVGCILFLISVLMHYSVFWDRGLEEYNISAAMNLSENYLCIYVLKKRVLQILIYLLMLYIFPYVCSSFLFCGAFGIYYGLVVSNLILKYELSGLLYGLICFFPHYYLYFLAIYILGKWGKESSGYTYQNTKFSNVFLKYFVIFLLITMSLIWEIKFQKNFLNYFFQYLV